MPKGIYKRTQTHRNLIRKGRIGMKFTEEHKRKLSEAKKGEKCYLWKGGISQNKEYINWQKNEWYRRMKRAEGSHTFGEWDLRK